MKKISRYNAKGAALLISAERAVEMDCFSYELMKIYLKSLADIAMEACMDAELSDNESGLVHDFMEDYANRIGEMYENKSF